MRSSAKELSQIETTQKAEKALSRGNGISKTNWQLHITKMLRVGVATTAHAETDAEKPRQHLKCKNTENWKPVKGQKNYDIILKELDT